MPKTPQVNLLYPNLQKTNPEKEQELYSSDLENTKLYVLNKGTGKIKFICIEFDEKSKSFFAKKYNFDAFRNEKGKGKIFYLAIGVKKNEVDKILKEMGEFLKLSISLSNDMQQKMDAHKQEKINKTISHLETEYKSQIIEYKTFEQLHQAYDRLTGENVSDKLNKLLNGQFSTLYKICREKEEEYGTQYVTSLKKILNEGEKEYKTAIEQHQHFSTNTFASLEKKIKDITDKFNNEIVQLENKNETEKRKERLDNLKAKVETLKHDCKNTCHEDGLYSKKIIEDLSILTQKVCFLLSNLDESKWKSFTEEEINGLEKKNNEYVGNLEILKKSINDLTSDKATGYTKEELTLSVNHLFGELKKLLDEIKIYKPSKCKEKIKENLEKEINNVLKQQGNSREDLNNAINKADKFIKDNFSEASSYTGGAVGKLFGKGQSILGELMHKLQELLDKLLELFPNHNFVSSRSSVSH